jgi:D-serine deaminase-like pyridoxal phosphate-dependent protein
VDAGLKAFATDGPLPTPVGERFAAAAYRYFGDEHGLLMRPEGAAVERGERVAFVVPHIDPTVDKYDVIHVVDGDVLVDILHVEARGAGQ